MTVILVSENKLIKRKIFNVMTDLNIEATDHVLC